MSANHSGTPNCPGVKNVSPRISASQAPAPGVLSTDCFCSAPEPIVLYSACMPLAPDALPRMPAPTHPSPEPRPGVSVATVGENEFS